MGRKFYFVLVVLIAGCSRIEHPQRGGLARVKTHLSLLDGTYKNQRTDSTPHSALWTVLTQYRTFNYDTTFSIYNSSVKLIAQNKKTILAQLYVDTSMIEQITIRGKIKGDYFVARRRIKYFGLPFIYLTYDGHKFQLAKDNSGKLILDGVSDGAGWILFFGTNSNYQYNFEYPQR